MAEPESSASAPADAEQTLQASLAAGGQSPQGMTPGDVERLLSEAEEALASINNPTANPVAGAARPFQLESLTGPVAIHDAATLDLLEDVQLNLKIELGRTQMQLEDVLRLRKGSVVPLDKSAGDPVDIYVNGRLIARGEVLVLNENFCVRVAELLAGDGHIDSTPI